MQQHILTNYVFTIDDFWSSGECEEFISNSEAVGYEPAAIETGAGQQVIKSIRNNNRVIYQDIELAERLWLQIKPYAPLQIGNSKVVGLNELFRFYKYQPGEEFKRHRDQSYVRPNGDASYYTFMIYLNENFKGGETKFDNIEINPRQGMALVFLHSLEHEGSPVKEGTKYVLRTDLMFRFED